MMPFIRGFEDELEQVPDALAKLAQRKAPPPLPEFAKEERASQAADAAIKPHLGSRGQAQGNKANLRAKGIGEGAKAVLANKGLGAGARAVAQNNSLGNLLKAKTQPAAPPAAPAKAPYSPFRPDTAPAVIKKASDEAELSALVEKVAEMEAADMSSGLADGTPSAAPMYGTGKGAKKVNLPRGTTEKKAALDLDIGNVSNLNKKPSALAQMPGNQLMAPSSPATMGRNTAATSQGMAQSNKKMGNNLFAASGGNGARADRPMTQLPGQLRGLTGGSKPAGAPKPVASKAAPTEMPRFIGEQLQKQRQPTPAAAQRPSDSPRFGSMWKGLQEGNKALTAQNANNTKNRFEAALAKAKRDEKTS